MKGCVAMKFPSSIQAKLIFFEGVDRNGSANNCNRVHLLRYNYFGI